MYTDAATGELLAIMYIYDNGEDDLVANQNLKSLNLTNSQSALNLIWEKSNAILSGLIVIILPMKLQV